MNPIIAGQISSFAAKEGLSGYSESDLFEIFSIYSVLSGALATPAEANSGRFPGADFGIDGGSLIINGEIIGTIEGIKSIKKYMSIDIIFFQSKTSAKFDYGDISKFFDSILSIINGTFRGSSEEAANFVNLVQEVFRNSGRFTKNPDIKAYYITTGSYVAGGEIDNLREDFFGRLKDMNLFSDIDLHFFGAKNLQDAYRRATDSNSITFNFKNRITMPENDCVTEAYLGYIPAQELLKIVSLTDVDGSASSINRKIFFDNVRDYDPDSEINRFVSNTIPDQSSSFVFRNNGVTIVARDGRLTGDSVKIEDFQIVNGCQTCNIIFENRNSGLGVLSIPLRLIISKDSEFINTIIVGTNKQNPVREEQFWALRPFLKDFEEYAKQQPSSRALFFERRENQYRYDELTERTRIIDAAALLKAVVSMFLGLPHRAGRDYREIKKEFSDSLFQDNHDVRIYYAAAYAHYRIEFCFRNNRTDITYKIYRMYILYAICNRFLSEQDIFKLKPARIEEITNNIIVFLEDEANLVLYVQRVAESLDGALRDGGYARNRDIIKSEEVFEKLKNSINLMNQKP